MSQPKFAAYYRVSTRKQKESGLGLDAQRRMCLDYIERQGGIVLKEFQDAMSGKETNRPGLLNAIDFCKANSTTMEPCTLVIAKLDRLARNVAFTFKVMETGISIYVCDLPVMNTLTLGVFAAVAAYERELIAGRTKSSLDSIREDIAKNGGHMSKAGRWIHSIGGQKGQDTSAASAAAAISHAKRARSWKDKSALFTWVENQVRRGRPRQEIIADAKAMFEKNPSMYGTRRGCALCEGTLSRWVKEIQCGI